MKALNDILIAKRNPCFRKLVCPELAFGLFAEEDITAANGETIPADGLIEIISVDENGNAAFKADIFFSRKIHQQSAVSFGKVERNKSCM